MTQEKEHLDALHDIRNIMDRSSRFQSISGLSGILAGIAALIGAVIVQGYLREKNVTINSGTNNLTREHGMFIILVALAVLAIALAVTIYFTIKLSIKTQQSIKAGQGKRSFYTLITHLAIGGVFCLALIYHELYYLIAPSTLVFYGISLIDISKITFTHMRYLGIFEVILGLAACFYTEWGILLWAAGFGMAHIVYGAIVYRKQSQIR